MKKGYNPCVNKPFRTTAILQGTQLSPVLLLQRVQDEQVYSPIMIYCKRHSFYMTRWQCWWLFIFEKTFTLERNAYCLSSLYLARCAFNLACRLTSVAEHKTHFAQATYGSVSGTLTAAASAQQCRQSDPSNLYLTQHLSESQVSRRVFMQDKAKQ